MGWVNTRSCSLLHARSFPFRTSTSLVCPIYEQSLLPTAIKGARKRYDSTFDGRQTLLTASICFAALIPLSRAQDAADTTLIASQLPSTTDTTATAAHAAMSTTGLVSSSTTAAAAYTTTSSFMSEPTNNTQPELFPGATGPHGDNVRNGAVFNYYFLFLVAFGVLLAAMLWWLRQQRKQQKERMRLSGQHALASDLEGWAGTRRFIHGRYRRYQTATHIQREEGFDENGEAPPPYQPKNDVILAHVPAGAAQAPANNLTIPLRTLSRDESERTQPPEYIDTNRAVEH